MRTLYVVTHPEATHHLEGVVGGWWDSSLTEEGVRVATRVATALREEVPAEESVEVFSSDLLRARQPAETVGSVFGTEVRLLAGLRELSYGEAEGRPQAWLDARYIPPPSSGDRLNHDHGVRGAETKAEFASRVYEAMEAVLTSPCRRQVLVTHGFTLTMLVACWIKMPLSATGYVNVRSSSGGITELTEDDHFHNRQIVRLNDVRHVG